VTVATVARLRREVASIRERIAPERPVLSPLEVAERVGLALDPWQVEIATSAVRQTIINASRQSGKSTITSVVAAREAAYRPDCLILLLSRALRQSQELFRKTKNVLAAMGDAAPPAVEESALRVELANGSRVICLPGAEASIRGYSAPTLVIEDEASRVPDDLHMAVRPMLAVSGGRLILLSTPFGKRGHFYETWERGVDWHRVMVTADQVARIPAAWLAQERAEIGDWWFDQEYRCIFKDAVDSYFRSVDIEAMAATDIEPLFPGGIRNVA
jgi:hypothetical protein